MAKESTADKLEEFVDVTALTDEMVEAAGGKQKDKSIRRRFLSWLDKLIHDHYKKKKRRNIQETAGGGQPVLHK